MFQVTADWKPIEGYYDLDGIKDRMQNRAAFKAFVDAFGWEEYMFHPVVMDFRKLLEGEADYNAPKREALGFQRMPDRSFEELGGHTRAFRKGNIVMLISMFNQLDEPAVAQWCEKHDCTYVVCDQSKAFHHNGQDILVFFVSRKIREQFADVINGFMRQDDN